MVPTFALLMLQAASVDPAKDPDLAKPITVQIALRPLREVVRTLTKEAGQPIAVASPVADLKATVLVKGLPAGRTMEALADTLGLAWRKESEGYRLFRPAEETKAIAAYLVEERAARMALMKGGLEAAEAAATPVADAADGGRGRPMRGPGRRAARSNARFDPSILAVESSKTDPPSRLDPATPTGDGPFAKANADWPKIDPALGPAWKAALRPVAIAKSTWENGTYTLADLLVAWHAATGLPVVADAFRVPMKASGPVPGWALESLQNLAAGDRLSLRVADGVARLRHPAYWRLREQEAPEDQWAALERSGKPTIGDFATFASGLTAPQAAAFRSLEAPLSHVPTEAVRQAYPALRLWATLPGAVQSALLAGRAVPLSAVGGTDAYLFALNEAPFYRAGDPSSALATNAARLGLFATGSPEAVTLRLGPERGGGVEYVMALR